MYAPLLTLALSLATVMGHGQSTPVGGAVPVADSGIQEMTPAQLSAMLGKPHVFVFDCNEADMHAEAHVPGAQLIVYDQVTADKLPTDKNATLVFYCYSPECPASHTAARTAHGLGYAHVFYMLAGITGWQDAGLPTEP